MITTQALAAFFFGALAALSLVIGAVLGVVWRPPQHAVAGLMAFGAGALLSALAFDLILTAHAKAGFGSVAVGGLIGGLSFVVLNAALNTRGGFLRKPATTARYLRARKREEAEALLTQLSQVALLRALPPEEVQAIVPHVETKAYDAGAYIFEQGDEGDALYLIDEGEIDLFVRAPEAGPRAGRAERPSAGDVVAGWDRIARLGPGDAFGEMALLTGEPRSATAVPATRVLLWRIPKDDFDELVAVSPALAAAVGQLLARNLEATSSRLAVEGDEAQRWQEIARRYVQSHAPPPTPTEVRAAARQHASAAPLAIFLGTLLDGISESFVIGIGVIGGLTDNLAFLVGVFLSNLPEALSSAIGMRAQGIGRWRIVAMWSLLVILSGVGAFLGHALLAQAPVGLIAAVEAFAAGAILTMVAETMLPEAYEQGGRMSGFATLLGFLAAFFVKTLGDGH